MSLLTAVKKAAANLGIPTPKSVIANSDDAVEQLLALANAEGQDLSDRYGWEALTKQNSFTGTTGTKNQGAINGTVIADSDYGHIINETFWNQDLTEPMAGPLNPVEIEQIEAFPVSGPYERWYMLGGNLYIDPAPSVAHVYQFQYKSDQWCESSEGAGQSEWLKDSDVFKLDENILVLGIVWRYLRRKGMDYTEEFATYERRIANATVRDGGKPRLNLNGNRNSRVPGIFVSNGSWDL